MPIDHDNLTVSQESFEDVVKFFLASTQHMGYKEMARPRQYVVGLGDTAPFFWINAIEGGDAETIKTMLKNRHIAFTASNVEDVKEFHAAALKAGGTCNGPPGPRVQYHPGYYGAFVLDPACGMNIEVCFHGYKGE